MRLVGLASIGTIKSFAGLSRPASGRPAVRPPIGEEGWDPSLAHAVVYWFTQPCQPGLQTLPQGAWRRILALQVH